MELLAVAWFALMRAGTITEFNKFTNTLYNDLASTIGTVSLSVVTLLVMIDGYRIVTGATTEPAATYVLKWLKVLVLIFAATTSGLKNEDGQNAVVQMSDALGVLIAGENIEFPSPFSYFTGDKDIKVTRNVYEVIGVNMAGISALSALATLVTSGLGSDNEVSKLVTLIFASIGTTLPIMTALMTSLLLELSLKTAVMMAPVCIFAGIFKRTEDWPLTWAKYTLSITIVSAMMAAMSSICVKLMVAYTAGAYVAYMGGQSMLVLSLLSTVIGFLLSMLLVSVPAVAVKAFGGIAEGVASNQLGGDFTGGMYNPENSQGRQAGGSNGPGGAGGQIVILSRDAIGSFRSQEASGGSSSRTTGVGNRPKGFGNRNLRFKNPSDK
jgi:type IV secretion system protein VirB6